MLDHKRRDELKQIVASRVDDGTLTIDDPELAEWLALVAKTKAEKIAAGVRA